MQARPARCLASTASGNSRRHDGVVTGAQARSTVRFKAIVEVRPGRGETGGPPGEAGTQLEILFQIKEEAGVVNMKSGTVCETVIDCPRDTMAIRVFVVVA